MTRLKSLFPFILMLTRVSVFADGGTLQWRKEAGAFAVTVFTSPAPTTAGPVDISLLVQNRIGLEPVLDADVSLLLREGASSNEVNSRPTRAQARNKFLYAAPVILSEPGKWQLAVTILRNGERTEMSGTIDVTAAPEMAASYWSYIAFPPFMTAVFVARERLIRRRVKR